MCNQSHYFKRIVVEMNNVSSIILKLIDEQLQIEFELIKTWKTNSSFSHKVIYIPSMKMDNFTYHGTKH